MSFGEVEDIVKKENLSGLSNELIICLIWKESSLNADAQSKTSTARGLMQMTKGALKEVQRKWNGFDTTTYESLKSADSNVSAGTAYVKVRQRRAGGDVAKGLDGYGTGEGYSTNILNCEKCLKEQNGRPVCSDPKNCLGQIN